MKKATRRFALTLALALALVMGLDACNSASSASGTGKASSAASSQANAEFVPQLDTSKAVELNASVFFGNFEALDQVINDFNEFYPNVTITYDASYSNSGVSILENNPYFDIFMTSTVKGYPTESCVDLKDAGVDFSAVADGMLASNTIDGKVLALPMGQTLRGIAVNKTLLEKEGLTMPQTWDEFQNVLQALKDKGYTPIQGPENAMGNISYNMGMAMLNSNPTLLQSVLDGKTDAATALRPAYDRLMELYDKGYISHEVNAEYPNDNYDGAIMKFLEGDVPFWVCDTEKVSGMKKRESKSEAFSANPFSYEFTFAPTGDKGVYEYIEPWYGFAVNKNSEKSDYAIEFLRFMARADELNTLASVKGVPSIAKDAPDERYANLNSIDKIELSAVCDGSVQSYIGTYLVNTATQLINGEVDSSDAALASFVSQCAESARTNG